MNWDNPAQVLQVIYWTCLFLVFTNGYSIGSRSVI